MLIDSRFLLNLPIHHKQYHVCVCVRTANVNKRKGVEVYDADIVVVCCCLMRSLSLDYIGQFPSKSLFRESDTTEAHAIIIE